MNISSESEQLRITGDYAQSGSLTALSRLTAKGKELPSGFTFQSGRNILEAAILKRGPEFLEVVTPAAEEIVKELKRPNSTYTELEGLVDEGLFAIGKKLEPCDVAIHLRRTPVVVTDKTAYNIFSRIQLV